jgi:hypothetical protein
VLVVGANAATPAADLFPNYDSYIKLTGQSATVTGNGSSFARRMQFPENGAYGIEALRINKEIDDATNLTVQGKALVGKEDYLGAFTLTKNEVGSVDVGYKRFRTFYDGIGGFFPLNNRWNQLSNPELHTDRAKFWAEAKIERPNAPKFEFRYTNEQRTGKKDSTIWGDSDFTGIPSYYGVGASGLNPPYSTNRKIAPAYIDMDERQQNLFAGVKHTVGNTDIEFEINHNISKSSDYRSVIRYPGELQLYPRQSSSTNPAQVYPPATISNEIVGYDVQNYDGSITSYTGKFETKFTDTVSVFGGLLYSDGSADIGGDRQMMTKFPTTTGVVNVIGGFVGATGRPAYSYTTTDGNVNEKVLAANVGVKFKPSSDLFGSLALKYEKTDIDGHNTVLYKSTRVDQATGATTYITGSAPNIADRSEKSWIPEAEVRYTGIKGLALYGTFDYRHSPGDEYGTSTGATTGGGLGAATTSYDNVKLNHAHYKFGANWTVTPIVTLRGEIYYKDHTNGFYGYNTNAGDSFVMGYEFFGQKLSAIVKPVSNLSFTTRLVHQTGKMDLTIDGGASMKSNDAKNYQFGETIDWAPNASTYVQANLNVAYNTIQTSYPVAGGLGNDVLHNADNNYRNGSLITGYAISKDTDASIQYTFYRADNFSVPNAATIWYGAGVKEYTYALALKHRFNEKLVGQFKVGYFNSENQTTGGNTNFKGPMAYISFDHAL